MNALPFLLGTASILALAATALPPLWPVSHAAKFWGICHRCGRGERMDLLYAMGQAAGDQRLICLVCSHIPAPVLRPA